MGESGPRWRGPPPVDRLSPHRRSARRAVDRRHPGGPIVDQQRGRLYRQNVGSRSTLAHSRGQRGSVRRSGLSDHLRAVYSAWKPGPCPAVSCRPSRRWACWELQVSSSGACGEPMITLAQACWPRLSDGLGAQHGHGVHYPPEIAADNRQAGHRRQCPKPPHRRCPPGDPRRLPIPPPSKSHAAPAREPAPPERATPPPPAEIRPACIPCSPEDPRATRNLANTASTPPATSATTAIIRPHRPPRLVRPHRRHQTPPRPHTQSSQLPKRTIRTGRPTRLFQVTITMHRRSFLGKTSANATARHSRHMG